MIQVTRLKGSSFEVKVAAKTPTSHQVNLSNAYYLTLTGGKITEEQLIEASFRFLLKREPNTSILRSFDLPVIGRYFPEYEETISRMI